MGKNDNNKIRYNIVTIFIYIVGIILILQLFNLQIVHGQEYRETSNTRLTRESVLKAARGNILDSTGNKLVTSETSFSLELYKTKIEDSVLNNTILKTINILKSNKDEYIDNLPIAVNPVRYTLPEENLKSWKLSLEIDENANAQEAFDSLKKKYNITNNDEEAIKIMAVRYEITRTGYSNIKPVEIAKDISRQSAIQIREQSNDLPGMTIATGSKVKYTSGNLASHILGQVGPISEEELKGKEDRYSLNDIVGKTGVEYIFEDYLKGTDGIKQIDMAVDGTVTEEYVTEEAVAGSDVVLTIDANLQKVAEEALKKNIDKIANGGFYKTSPANAGAVIVMNVKTGEVLAMASYPDYNPQLFIDGISQEQYDSYKEGKKLVNRAISGVYSPGSIYKMVTATAGLETGAITTKTKINDTGVYPKFGNPVCWYWRSYRRGHGYLNVTQAIQKSCNYFFYETGYRAGIENIVKYAEYYGLGMKTGIELLGEEIGTISRPEIVEARGEVWTPGYTLSAAIGQGDNGFTPIQMARYISSLANGGNRVDVTLIKNIMKPDGTEVDKKELENYVNERLGYTPTEVEDLNIKEENIDAILEGMKGVTEDGGTAYSTFAGFDIEVAGKTGSAETGDPDKVNGWFVGFAPFDDPEISVTVLIENAGSGGFTAETARDIMAEYFGMNANEVKEDMTAIPSTQVQR
ncbi:MAG: penicillin-binding transpeptidase domain-containing protein [Clostridia bacterium]|nr:penicillin-binding transpeptidase domain-containing protein [Clostridia bacterium]